MNNRIQIPKLMGIKAWVGLFFCAMFLPAVAAEGPSEQALITTLQTSNSPQEKDAACVQLKKVATAASVPALAALLTDAQLSQSARYVLESMDSPEAGRALVQALEKTSGALRVGIVNSLGNRREASAVDALSKSIQTAGSDTAAQGIAAAIALGKIGGPTAVAALSRALNSSVAPLRDAVIDGLLRAANALVSAGDRSSAKAIFEQLYEKKETTGVRTAAYAGMIRSAGEGAMELVVKGIEGTDAAGQLAALQLARDPQGPAAGRQLATLLPNAKPPLQVALLGAISQRGEVLSDPAITQLVKSGAPEVRAAALEALGNIGTSAEIPLLTAAAASETGAVQAVARRSLNRLNRGPVMEALITQLKNGEPRIQAEAARALGERSDMAAIPMLLALAEQASGSSRGATLQALALLAQPGNLDSMVQLVVKGGTDSAREGAAQALNAAMQRLKAADGAVPVQSLVRALAPGNSAQTRAALLPVCSGLGDPQIRSALRSALADPDPVIHSAAVRALCDSGDVELLPDLEKVACTAPEANFRTLAIAACVRLTTQEGAAQSAQRRVEVLQAILATPLKTEQKRQVLSGLAEIPDPAALKLVEPMLADPDVRSEAATAAVKIAPTLPDAELASSILKKIITAAPGLSACQSAEAALKQIEARSGFITAWQVAGPFRQPNKNYAALFDVAFAPEEKGANVEWRVLPPSDDASRPWAMDLLKSVGGEQCVAYARTWVFSPRAQAVRLEIGSDDGAKIWVNDKLVHANNTARALQPAQDKADAQLREGWNALLVKVTQNNLGWGFCLRISDPDGARMEGLRASLSPK